MLSTELPDALSLLKTLADPSRLRMVSWLAEREYAAGELAERLGLSEPTVSHHVARLHAAGLVQLRMAGTQRFYRLNPERLARFRAYVADLDKPLEEPADIVNDTGWIDALALSPEDKKVLADYTLAGRLTRFPSKEKKWLSILRWLATRFESGRRYSEREVNANLIDVHADYASLRRDLVEFGFMRRQRGGGDYWLAPEDEPPSQR
jgi:DNA-binding transcriptional ArsR family regulator